MTFAPYSEEVAIYRPPARQSVSEWSAEHRVIPVGDAAFPGLWNPSITPYAVEVLDTYNDPYVQEVTGCFGAQTGKSTIGENLIGYIVDKDPSPMLWVMPRKEDYHYVHGSRIEPMIHNSPKVGSHLTDRADDVTQESITFDNCRLYYAMSSSTRSLKSKAVRVVILDEIDEFRDGPQGCPIAIVRQRTNTFGSRRKIYKWSTPTFETGKVWVEWLKSDQRKFLVPCPECDHYQELVWDQVKWDGSREELEAARESARYECVACNHEIRDAARYDMIRRGVWCPKGARVEAGELLDEPAPSRHRGYHLSSLYAITMTLGELCARFLTGDLADFTRQNLALPWEVQHTSIREGDLEDRIGEYQHGTVPEEAVLLTAGVDVQGEKLGFYVVVRAWSATGESWLVRAVRVFSWAGVNEAAVTSTYGGHRISVTFVDAGDGNRDDEVYAFCRRRHHVVVPTKGQARQRLPLSWTAVDRHPVTKQPIQGGLKLCLLHTLFFKDWLASSIGGDRAPWSVHANTEGRLSEYLQHMRAEQRVIRNGLAYWVTKPGKTRNDYLDAEVSALAAWYHRVGHAQASVGRDESENAAVADAMRAANTERQTKPAAILGRGLQSRRGRGRW